jgi:hypothetical protein
MKKTASALTLFAFLLVLSCGMSFSQQADLSGTWVGPTEVPDAVEPDILTLVLKKEEGKYSGTITDSMGMLQDTEIENVEFKDNTLTFTFQVDAGGAYLTVHTSLTVKGDKMSGYWETDEGDSSPIELERKK